LIGPFLDKVMTREMIDKNVNLRFNTSNSKSRKELGITYRPLEESMNEFFEQLIENDLV